MRERLFGACWVAFRPSRGMFLSEIFRQQSVKLGWFQIEARMKPNDSNVKPIDLF